MLKSRVARSSSIGPVRGVKSTVRPSSSATRQAPCRSERGKGAPPDARAYRRAARSGAATATSTSTIGRSSASSRTAPPTIQASSPANSSSTSSRIDDHPPGAGGIAVDPANQLVVDRAGHAGMIFRHHPVAEQRHRRAGGELAIELDGEGVHRDRADDAARLASDPYFGSGQVAAKAVRVADGDDPDPRRPLGHEAAAVTGALAGGELPNLREQARPLERRLEAVVPRGVAERRETVDRDAAAGGVEAGVRKAERTGAVSQVPGQVPVRLRRLAEHSDLGLRELGIAVGAREMAHQPEDLDRRLWQLREAPAAHAGVDLEVDADALGDLAVRDGELERGLSRR